MNLKHIDKILKDCEFSPHNFCKTLIVLIILIYLSGYSLSCTALPNLKKTEDKESINDGKTIGTKVFEDKEYQIFAFSLDREIYLLTLSKDKKIIRRIETGLVGEIDGDPKITSDGKKVLFSFRPATDRHHCFLYVINIDGTEKRNITEGMWLMYSASLSPNGKKVAFIGKEEEKDSPYSLWIVNIDGTENIDLLKGKEVRGKLVGSPVFSPDSKKILFKSGETTECLYMFDLEKDKLSLITLKPRESIGQFFFLPDNISVLFLSIYTNQSNISVPNGLNIVNIDGTERKKITEGVGVLSSAAVSPDGKKIAFIGRNSDYSPNPSLCLVNTDGTEMRNLLKGVEIKGELKKDKPVFSPDGRRILFSLKQPNSESLCMFDLDKENIITLVEAKIINEAYSYQFSPDGRKILFVASFKGDEVTYFIGTDNLTGKPIYNECTLSKHLIINNDGSSMISIEEIILTNIIYTTWFPPDEESK